MSRAWVTQLDDNRTNYRFHQSWLADTDLCLERARLGLLGDLLDPPSDATSVGTAMHYAIECCLEDIIHDEGVADAAVYSEIAQGKFTELIAEPDFVWKKRKERGARSYLTKAFTNWYEAILPRLDPLHTELNFGPYLLYEDEVRRVELGGTIDYIDRVHGIMDWKSGSAHSWEGKDWEKSRAAIQPTVYCWAWMVYCEDHGLPAPPIPQPFHFVALLDNGAVQKVKVERRPEDYEWLKRKVHSVVTLIEADLPEWPRRDNENGLCSPKWCPAWSQCKGKHVHEDWPK